MTTKSAVMKSSRETSCLQAFCVQRVLTSYPSHHLWLLTFDDKLFLAPLEEPERILDLGTGTGLWAM